MGLFRPARTVTGPRGDFWEIYVSKTALPSWQEGADRGELASGNPELDLFGFLFATIGAIWAVVVVPLLRVVVLLPVAFVRGRRSSAVRIEAVTNYPEREVLLWTTTGGFVDGVLDEIVDGLAAGKVVQPTGAVYSGRS